MTFLSGFLSALLAFLLSLVTYQHEVLMVNAGDFLRVLPRLERHGWRVAAWAECELAREKVARVVMVKVRWSQV